MAASKDQIECADDLLARILLATQNKEGVTKQTLERSMELFPSAIVINSLINKNLIVGHKNQEVYEVYKSVATEMGIPVISKIVFSRTLCRYYGFSVVNKTIKGKKHRIYQEKGATKSSNPKTLTIAEEYVSKYIEQNDVIDMSNHEIYDTYQEWCRQNCQSICSIIAFSRIVCNKLDVILKSTNRNGKKRRYFAMKVGA